MRLDEVAGELRGLRRAVGDQAEAIGQLFVLATATARDVQALRNSRASRPDLAPLSSMVGDLDTDQREALSRQQAEEMIERRDMIADVKAKTAQIAEFERRDRDRLETTSAWRRLLVPVVVSVVLGAVLTYTVTRVTQPRFRQTVESK